MQKHRAQHGGVRGDRTHKHDDDDYEDDDDYSTDSEEVRVRSERRSEP